MKKQPTTPQEDPLYHDTWTLLRKYREQSKVWAGDLCNSLVSGVVGTHVGPGAVAVAFFAAEKEREGL